MRETIPGLCCPYRRHNCAGELKDLPLDADKIRSRRHPAADSLVPRLRLQSVYGHPSRRLIGVGQAVRARRPYPIPQSGSPLPMHVTALRR